VSSAILVSLPNLNIVAAINGVVATAFSSILFNFFYYNLSSKYIIKSIKKIRALAAPGLKRLKTN